MSFSKFLSNLGHVLVMSFLFIFEVLLIPAGVIFVLIIGVTTGICIAPAVLIPIMLAVYSLPLNWFLGFACGGEFVNTGYVHEGNSVIELVRDEAYYKRAVVVHFVIMSLFIISTICFGFIVTFNFVWGMVGLIQSIIGAIFYFLFAKSAIEKSGIKNKNKQDKEEFAEYFKTKEPIKKEKVIKTKFNFENYPNMREVYLSFKDNKNKAIRLKGDSVKVEEYNQACLNRDAKFEELSKAIFETFNVIKPVLINKKTNEKVKWEDLFNVPFEKLTKKQKDYMVRLLDAQPYMFENKKFYNN